MDPSKIPRFKQLKSKKPAISFFSPSTDIGPKINRDEQVYPLVRPNNAALTKANQVASRIAKFVVTTGMIKVKRKRSLIKVRRRTIFRLTMALMDVAYLPIVSHTLKASCKLTVFQAESIVGSGFMSITPGNRVRVIARLITMSKQMTRISLNKRKAFLNSS